MTDNNKRKISAIVSKKFHDYVSYVASRRFLNRRGYMTMFIVMSVKITLRLHNDEKLVKEVNKYVNSNYTEKKYDDRLAHYVEDCIREHLMNHGKLYSLFFIHLIVVPLFIFMYVFYPERCNDLMGLHSF